MSWGWQHNRFGRYRPPYSILPYSTESLGEGSAQAAWRRRCTTLTPGVLAGPNQRMRPGSRRSVHALPVIWGD